MFRDFTLYAYEQLLLTLQQCGYSFFTFEDYCLGKANANYIILRHDVDSKPANSLEFAKIEARLGIRSSYYFRCVAQSNQPVYIKAIVELGHEIGFHYEDLTLYKGNYEKAIQHFEVQLTYFRGFYPVKTISMHGSPMSKLDNRDIWKKYNYKDFGIIGEPYFDFINSDAHLNPNVFYFTDTARMWNGDKYNIRDKKQKPAIDLANEKFHQRGIHSTFDLIQWIKDSGSRHEIMITTHPQRWNNNELAWWLELIGQRIRNGLKAFLVVKRKR